MYERFSDEYAKTIQLANQEAQRLNHEYIAIEHVLIAMCMFDSRVVKIFRDLEVNDGELVHTVRSRLEPGPDTVTMGKLPQTPSMKKVIEISRNIARERGDREIGTEHLLLSILRSNHFSCWILDEMGVTISRVWDSIVRLRSKVKEEKKTLSWLDETTGSGTITPPPTDFEWITKALEDLRDMHMRAGMNSYGYAVAGALHQVKHLKALRDADAAKVRESVRQESVSVFGVSPLASAGRVLGTLELLDRARYGQLAKSALPPPKASSDTIPESVLGSYAPHVDGVLLQNSSITVSADGATASGHRKYIFRVKESADPKIIVSMREFLLGWKCLWQEAERNVSLQLRTKSLSIVNGMGVWEIAIESAPKLTWVPSVLPAEAEDIITRAKEKTQELLDSLEVQGYYFPSKDTNDLFRIQIRDSLLVYGSAIVWKVKGYFLDGQRVMMLSVPECTLYEFVDDPAKNYIFFTNRIGNGTQIFMKDIEFVTM